MMTSAQELVAAAKQAIREVEVKNAAAAIEAADVLIDVREPEEFVAGHIPNAISMPRGMLEFQLESHPELSNRATKIVLYCKTSGRAALAAQSLQAMGYQSVVSILGGFDAWVEAGQAVAKASLPSFG